MWLNHGGIKVGERLSDTEVDDARDSGIRVRHMKEDTEEEQARIPFCGAEAIIRWRIGK